MAIKKTNRKGFNFFRSYYDVYNELPIKDKIAFIDALLDRQFLGVKPTTLKGMASFAYISQVNSIDSQIKGYNDKAQALGNPTLGGAVGVEKNLINPTEQVQVKEKEEEKGKVQAQDVYRKFAHLKLSFEEFDKLKEKHTQIEIDDCLDSIENYKKNTSYKSLYLTLNKWLKKDKEKSSDKKETPTTLEDQFKHLQ